MRNRRTSSKARNKSKRTKPGLLSVICILGLALVVLGYTFAQRGAACDKQALREYVVQPGDTLWGIAKDHISQQHDIRVFVKRLQVVNNLSGPIIQPGQSLLLPTP